MRQNLRLQVRLAFSSAFALFCLLPLSGALAGELEVGGSAGFGTGTSHGHVGLQGQVRATGDFRNKAVVIIEGAAGSTSGGESLTSLNLGARSSKDGVGYDGGLRHQNDAHTRRNVVHGGVALRRGSSFTSLGVIVGEHEDEDFDNKGVEAGILLVSESVLAGGNVSLTLMGELASLREMSGEGPLAGLNRTQEVRDSGRYRAFSFNFKKRMKRENLSAFAEILINSRSYKTLQYGINHVTGRQDAGNVNAGFKAGLTLGLGSNSAR